MFSWNRLHSGVKAIFFLQIVNRMGDFVVPFLTLILTQVQGFSPAVAGLVVTLSSALSTVGGLVAGRLGDRRGRRDTLVVFLGISGLLLGGAGFAPAHLVSAAAMVASGFFLGAMRPLLGALVADLSTPETRRAAFSLSYLGINIGVAVGPLLAGWLFNHALNWLFWLDALSTAAALLILIRFVPRTTGEAPAPSPGEATSSSPAPSSSPSAPSALGALLRHPILVPLCLLTLAYNLVYAQLVFSLSLQLVDQFGPGGAATFGLVWAVNALVVVAATPILLPATHRWTNLASMALGMVFLTLGLAAYLGRPDLPLIVVSTVLWSLGEVLFSIHWGDLVASHSPPELRARFQAYVGFATGLGFVVAPTVGGLVAQTLGLVGVWALGTGTVALTGVGFLLLDRRARRLAPVNSPG